MMTKKKDLPFEKSFASCDKAKYWHYEKNGITPNKVSNITIINFGLIVLAGTNLIVF